MKALLALLATILCFGSPLAVAQPTPKTTATDGPAQAGPQIPPNISAILDKIQSGKTISPDEQAALENWTSSVAGMMQTGAVESAICPDTQNADKLPTRAPSRDDFVRSSKAVATAYGSRLGASRVKLDTILESETSAPNLSVFLLMSKSGSAAAYAAASSALRYPDDDVIASNLGVILGGTGDELAATSALLYAQKLSPKSATAAVNLGWLYFRHGDYELARNQWELAANLQPDSSGTKVALGILAECECDHQRAATFLRAGLSKSYSFVGAAAYQQAKAGGACKILGRPSSAHTEATDTATKPQTENSNPTQEQLAQQEEAQQCAVKLPILPLNPNVSPYYNSDQSDTFMSDAYQRLVGVQEQYKSSADAWMVEQQNRRLHMSVNTPDTIDLEYVYAQQNDKMNEILSRADSLHDTFMHSYGEVLSRVMEPMLKASLSYTASGYEYQRCLEAKKAMQYAYSSIYPILKEKRDIFPTQACLVYKQAGSVLQEVWDPRFNAVLNDEVQDSLITYWVNVNQAVYNQQLLLKTYHELKCVPPEPPIESAPKAADVPRHRGNCPFENGFKIVVPAIAELEFDCEKVRVQVGEGLLGSFEKDFRSREVTFGIGAGLEGGTVVGGFDARVMFEMTVGEQGELLDLAVAPKAGFNLGVGLRPEAEAKGRISLLDGPSFAKAAPVPGVYFHVGH